MRKRLTWSSAARWTGLVACLLLAAAWLVSGFRYIELDRSGGQDRTAIAIAAGRATVLWGQPALRPGTSAHWNLLALPPVQVSQSTRWGWRWQFEFITPPRIRTGGWLTVPLWAPFTLLALPSAWLWRRWYMERRPRPGQCPKCRYDLSGTTIGRCPECGAKWRSQ